MAKAQATRRRPARLSFKDGEVVVTPRDQDIFLISAERATEACREAVLHTERVERFTDRFLVPLHDWCLTHRDRVRACYVTLPGRHLQVFIVTSSPRFDFDLAEEVAALELQLANNGWVVGVSQLPHAEDSDSATFFDPEEALEVYAKCGSAPPQGGA